MLVFCQIVELKWIIVEYKWNISKLWFVKGKERGSKVGTVKLNLSDEVKMHPHIPGTNGSNYQLA